MSVHDRQSNNDDYYSILGLQRPRNGDSKQVTKDEIKAAYHRTLLLHHPDKVSNKEPSGATCTRSAFTNRNYSIDQIMQAYQTLSNPILRATYDEELVKGLKMLVHDNAAQGTHLGVEVYDLDDLDFSELTGLWSKPCRCAHEDGYVLTESELEKERTSGEVYVGCRGCSLFIKVLFGIVEDAGSSPSEHNT